MQGSSTSREMRARHNLASQLSEDDPKRSLALLIETVELAGAIGDRAMFNWAVGTLGLARLSAGEGWDEQVALSRDALETSTLRPDRARLRILLGDIEAARGEHLEELVREIDEICGDSPDPIDLLTKLMARADTSLVKGELAESHRFFMEAAALETPVREFALVGAARAAIWIRDPARLRRVIDALAALRSTGQVPQAYQARDTAALAALEGRPADALARFREARDQLRRLEEWFDYASFAIDALMVLPEEAEIRAWAEEARPILEGLRARPYLERLDGALASAPTTAPVASSEAARTPAR
jgi:hypothetical protein